MQGSYNKYGFIIRSIKMRVTITDSGSYFNSRYWYYHHVILATRVACVNGLCSGKINSDIIWNMTLIYHVQRQVQCRHLVKSLSITEFDMFRRSYTPNNTLAMPNFGSTTSLGFHVKPITEWRAPRIENVKVRPENTDGLVQDCSISISNTLDILQSCT